MRKITHLKPGKLVTRYSLRNLYVDLLDRVRVAAAVATQREGRDVTMEEIFNQGLSAGLPSVERKLGIVPPPKEKEKTDEQT